MRIWDLRFRVLIGHTPEQSPQLRAGVPSVTHPKGPSTQILGFQGPETIQSMDFGT